MPHVSRRWCFTLHNPPRDDTPNDWMHSGDITYCIWQKEQAPSTGLIHLQGYFVTKENPKNKNGFTLKWVKENINNKMTVAACKGTHEENVAYCSKAATRVAGPWIIGSHVSETENRKKIEERRKVTLQDVKEDIDKGLTEPQLWKKHFGHMCRYNQAFARYHFANSLGQREQPRIFCYWGEPGCGKSERARAICKNNGGGYWWNSNNACWFDGYEPMNHPVVVFDDFKGNLPYSLLLRLLDRYPLQVEKKGSMVAFNPKIIVITSNEPPNRWYFQKPEDANHDCSALLRRLQDPYGLTREMKKTADYVVAPEPLPNSVIEEEVYEGWWTKKDIKSAPVIDLTTDEVLPDGEWEEDWSDDEGNSGDKLSDYVTDEDEYNDRKHSEWIASGRPEPMYFDTSSSSTSLRRTDSLTFQRPLAQAGRFKKLGTGPVQTELFLPPAPRVAGTKRKSNDDDDNDE